MSAQLILASRSPRRLELLAQLGLDVQISPADIDETPRPNEGAEGYVCRMAQEKAEACLQVQGSDLPVLGSDTSVIVDGEILGKPDDETEFLTMGRVLRGRSHQVMTAVAMVQSGQAEVRLSTSDVRMKAYTLEHWRAYWRSGEPKDKAGGYAVQGLGAVFIEHIQGSYSGIMGLPLFETAELLEKFGIDVLGSS